MLRIVRRLVFLLCLTFIASHSFAQSSSIAGEVSDSQGAVIPNAEVKIVHQTQGTTRTTHTNASGYYDAPFLNPGTYRIYVQAPKFSMAASDALVLAVGQSMVFNVQ